MGDVSRMEISTVIGHGDRRSIEILEQFKISFSGICTLYHIALPLAKSHYSPMILTSTRFRRRPSRLPGQPFRPTPKDLLPGPETQPAPGDRHQHLAAHHAQLGKLRSASGARR